MRVCFALCQRRLAPLKSSSSLRCFARLLPVGLLVKKNVVCENLPCEVPSLFFHPPKKCSCIEALASFSGFLLSAVKPALRWLGTVVTSHTASNRQAYTPVMSMLQKAVQSTHCTSCNQPAHTNAIMLYAAKCSLYVAGFFFTVGYVF